MDLNYYKMTPKQKVIYKSTNFFKNLGKGFTGFFLRLFKAIIAFFPGIGRGL